VKDKTFYLILFVAMVLILLICIYILVRAYLKLIDRNKSLLESIANLSALNDQLRMDRHDYLNHLQVVHGLMELEEYEEMRTYLRKVYKNLLKTGKAIKTSKPAINALLAAKMAECDTKEIDLVVEVKSDLKNIGIEDWELCKVLSNLIDNAIRALEDTEKSEKRIRINLTETKKNYIFDVENNGPKIPDDIQKHIFDKGFTTKKEKGHGMGLAIVSNILSENKGRIELESSDEKTIFTISFEKGA